MADFNLMPKLTVLNNVALPLTLQGVALARTLANDPALIRTDEPTSNLHSRTSAELLAIIARLHTEGATILLVTHARMVAE